MNVIRHFCVSMFAAVVLSSTALASPLFTYSFMPTDVTGLPGTTPDEVFFLTQQLSLMRITTTQGQGFLSFVCIGGCTFPEPVIGITEFKVPGVQYVHGFFIFDDPGDSGTGTLSIFAQGDHFTSGMIHISTNDWQFIMDIGSGSMAGGSMSLFGVGSAIFHGTWVLTGVVEEPGTLLLLLTLGLAYLFSRRTVVTTTRGASTKRVLHTDHSNRIICRAVMSRRMRLA